MESNPADFSADSYYNAVAGSWSQALVFGTTATEFQSTSNHPVNVFPVACNFISLSQLIPSIKLWKSRSEKAGAPLTIILDSAANINLFSTCELLDSIHYNNKLKKEVTGASGKPFWCAQIGKLAEALRHLPLPTSPYYFTTTNNNVNVVSLGLLAISYNFAIDDAFYAYKEDVGYIHIQKDPKTLMYTLNVNKCDEVKVLNTITNVVTVKDKQKHFSNLECARANSARNLQNVLMGLRNKDLAHAIKNNTIRYNALRRKDVNNAKEIFGPSESIIKAKTVQKKSKMIQEDKEIELQKQVMEKFESITLFVYVFHVNGISILVSKSSHIGHHIVIPILHKDADHYVRQLMK